MTRACCDCATSSAARVDSARDAADPVRLEVFGNRCMSIAEQMGAVLRNTSVSTNIKERLDYSCAVFDAQGGLVANAPHIPVHLGAMAETVAVVRERFPSSPRATPSSRTIHSRADRTCPTSRS
jgi:5-oxoprolinase (ATP-hydrolysing)